MSIHSLISPIDSSNTLYIAGMVGSKDGGKMRAPQRKEQKVGLTKKQKTSTLSMSSGNTNGLSSSLVFTPVNYPILIHYIITSLT